MSWHSTPGSSGSDPDQGPDPGFVTRDFEVTEDGQRVHYEVDTSDGFEHPRVTGVRRNGRTVYP
jgi:hypothetical protein